MSTHTLTLLLNPNKLHHFGLKKEHLLTISSFLELFYLLLLQHVKITNPAQFFFPLSSRVSVMSYDASQLPLHLLNLQKACSLKTIPQPGERALLSLFRPHQSTLIKGPSLTLTDSSAGSIRVSRDKDVQFSRSAPDSSRNKVCLTTAPNNVPTCTSCLAKPSQPKFQTAVAQNSAPTSQSPWVQRAAAGARDRGTTSEGTASASLEPDEKKQKTALTA